MPEDDRTGEKVMPAIVTRRPGLSRLDLENALVLVIGWVVALAVTWT